MRTLTATLAAAALLAAAAPAWGQTAAIQKKLDSKLKQAREREKKKAEAKLEELLARALKSNPDLRVAEAKVRTAEAERDQLRLKLVQEVTVAQAELERARDAVATAKESHEVILSMFAQGRLTGPKEMADAAAALQQAKANLAAAEAKLAYLVGRQPAPDLAPVDSAQNVLRLERDLNRLTAQQALAAPGKAATPRVKGTLEDKLRKALATPFRIPDEASLADVLTLLRAYLKGINVINSPSLGTNTPPSKLKLTEPVPVGAALQLIEDEFNCRFILRDYGIRVVGAQEAVPPGAVFVVDFWRAQPQGAGPYDNFQERK